MLSPERNQITKFNAVAVIGALALTGNISPVLTSACKLNPDKNNAAVWPTVATDPINKPIYNNSINLPPRYPSSLKSEKLKLVVRPKTVSSAKLSVSHEDNVSMPPILKRIGGCESGSGPDTAINYRAENSSSTASGGFQFLDSTWDNYDGYARAMDAPPSVQIAKAEEKLAKDGTSPWAASEECWD